MFLSLRRRLPRLGRVPRLLAAGSCLLLALNSAADAASAGTSGAGGKRTVPVVVAARALPVGHLLTRVDVRVVRWPAGLSPVTARADPSSVLGRRLTGPLAAREPVTGNRVLGRDLVAGLPDGLVAAAVAVGDVHAVDLVRPGDRVDLFATPRVAEDFDDSRPAGPVTTVVRGALTLAVFGDAPGAGAEIVLAVPRPTAVAITRDSGTHVFTVVTAPP